MRNRFALTCSLLVAIALAGGTVAMAKVERHGNLQVSVDGRLSPDRLPGKGKAPIAVAIDWKVVTTDGSSPPQLKTLKIEINRNGVLDPTGLPVCPYDKIQPASTSRALANCRSALVGEGSFAAIVGADDPEGESYVAKGRMLVFNSKQGGKPVLFGQIFSERPFANSFVITFKIGKSKRGTFGTTLTADLPASLRAWGNLTEINMRLSRKFAHQGKRRSFLTAGCPIPEGFRIGTFKLARTSFSFVDGGAITTILTDTCRVKR